LIHQRREPKANPLPHLFHAAAAESRAEQQMHAQERESVFFVPFSVQDFWPRNSPRSVNAENRIAFFTSG